MFTTKELFSKALMIELPWFIEKMEFDQTQGKLDVWIDFARGSEFFFEDKTLGISGKFKAYDSTVKTWRHMNFFQYQCYLHAKVPRVDLGNGKYRLVKTPWEGLSNGFTLLFEAMLMELVRLMPVRQVAKSVQSDGTSFVGSYEKVYDAGARASGLLGGDPYWRGRDSRPKGARLCEPLCRCGRTQDAVCCQRKGSSGAPRLLCRSTGT